MSQIKHISIRVMGKVQGVWFRDSARRKAQELEITGFARNEPDGSVHIEAEGDEDALIKLAEWCRSGPERARVDAVQIEEGTVKGLQGFEIRRF